MWISQNFSGMKKKKMRLGWAIKRKTPEVVPHMMVLVA